jgi:hypothetical protein
MAVLAATLYAVASGCGNDPSVPTIDQIRKVPDSSQSVILVQDQFSPKEGPLGTLVTIFGRGVEFPAGIVRVQMSGSGAVQFDNPDPTQELKFRIPFGSISGPFGFTISARNPLILDNALPSSSVFQAWRFEAPGFRVIDPPLTGTPFPDETSGQSQHPLPNSGNNPTQGDVH